MSPQPHAIIYQSQPVLCLTDNGLLYEQTITHTAVQGDFKRLLIQDELRGSISISPAITEVRDNEPLHFLVPVNGPITHALIRLRTLNFHTAWVQGLAADGETKIWVPNPNVFSSGTPAEVLNSAVNPEAAAKELLWTIPDQIPTWLSINVLTNELAIMSWHNGQRALLPLPNMWSEGRLCFKPGITVPGDLLNKAKTLYHAWVHSIWNQDLGKAAFAQTFQWDFETGKQLDLDFNLVPPSEMPVDLRPVWDTVEKQMGYGSGQ